MRDIRSSRRTRGLPSAGAGWVQSCEAQREISRAALSASAIGNGPRTTDQAGAAYAIGGLGGRRPGGRQGISWARERERSRVMPDTTREAGMRTRRGKRVVDVDAALAWCAHGPNSPRQAGRGWRRGRQTARTIVRGLACRVEGVAGTRACGGPLARAAAARAPGATGTSRPQRWRRGETASPKPRGRLDGARQIPGRAASAGRRLARMSRRACREPSTGDRRTELMVIGGSSGSG